MKKWLKASGTMLVRTIFYSLWCLTIAGAFIKRLLLLPGALHRGGEPGHQVHRRHHPLPEDDEGHKWECFLFELSFLGWGMLGFLTLGLFNVLFTNPYKTAALTRYYAQRRQEAKEQGLPGAQLLFDTYLFEKAPPSRCWKRPTATCAR